MDPIIRAKRLLAACAVSVLLAGCAFGATRSPSPGTAGASPAAAVAAASSTLAAAPMHTPNPPGWMTVERDLHTATLLADSRVLIAGGFTNGLVALPSAELFDPRTGSFSRTGAMTTARQGHVAALLDDGRVLIAGGDDDTGTVPLASAELYDPKTGTFAATGSMAVGRWFATPIATVLADGRVLVTGGQGESNADLASAEVYDPKAGTFSPTGSMTTRRAGQSSTLLADGRVLIAGGTSDNGICLTSAELYDPKTGVFSPTGSTKSGACGQTATRLADGRVLLAGGAGNWEGYDLRAMAELYDPTTGTFSPTGSLSVARTLHTATLLSDGRVLVVGGGTDTAGLASAELYDPTTGTFGPTGSVATGRCGNTATLLADGRVLVTGGDVSGYNLRGPFVASAEIYDPTTGAFGPTE